MFKKIGPGVLVVAAFIGPGTVTVCTIAGAGFGYALLWTLLLSIVATIVLQEMAARLGIVTQRGLADVIKAEIGVPWLRTSAIFVMLSAIVIGNTAYEAGNIGGAALGLESVFGSSYAAYYPVIIGAMAAVLLYVGSYKTLEKVFISLVVIMSLSFLLTALITRPNVWELVKGTFWPSLPSGSMLTIIALVGTTVVPYNLFLHASLVSEKWKSVNGLKDMRRDTFFSIAFGGLVSMAVIVAAAAIPGKEVHGVLDLAKGLEPLYGNWANLFMGTGLFAAGITSAITAPLAAAYVASSCFGWGPGTKDPRFRAVWMFILALGAFFLSFGIRPIEVIQFAQVANGIILPVIAIFLIWAVNRGSVMQGHTNTRVQNLLGAIIIGLTIVLGIKSILTVFGLF